MGRCAAVQRDAERAHAHPQARGDRHLASSAAASSASTSSVRSSTAGSTSSTRSATARRHSVQVPPPDVAGELRGRPRLPRPPVPGGQPRAAVASSTRRSARSPARRWTAAKPLWEMYFIEGLANGRIAVLGKIHHALADGVASANLLARGMDLQRARGRPRLVRDRSRARPQLNWCARRSRPPPPDRPAARRDALHRAGHRPGAARVHASCRPS